MRMVYPGPFGLIVVDSHPHHGIPCVLNSMRWCLAIDRVLTKIQDAASEDYAYLCERIHHIGRLEEEDERRGTGAAFWPSLTKIDPSSEATRELIVPVGHGWIDFGDMGGMPMEEHEYIVAHEFAHGLDIMQVGGLRLGVPNQYYEDRTHGILDRWGFAMPRSLAEKHQRAAERVEQAYAITTEPPEGTQTHRCEPCNARWWLANPTYCPSCNGPLKLQQDKAEKEK